MFNVQLVSDEIDNFNVFENVEINFSKSIEFNAGIDPEIKKVYRRTINNRAKFLLGCFHLNIFNSLEYIINNTNEVDDFILDVTEFIAEYFDNIEFSLNITNIEELNEFTYILELSSILIKSALEVNDMELIYEAFFQIESRFKKANLVNENISELYLHIYSMDFIEINYDCSDVSDEYHNNYIKSTLEEDDY